MTDTVRVDEMQVAAYTIPTASPEADGTYEWKETTLVTVHVKAGDVTGFGYTYASTAVAILIEHALAKHVLGADCMSPRGVYDAMVREVRNLGRAGMASMAISAVDVAVHDLKARVLGIPLVGLLGAVRPAVAAYGSGGFTSYSDQQLTEQLGGWAAQGLAAVKMKIGTHPELDLARVRAARQAIGNGTELYVDANGAYDRKQALRFAEVFVDSGVTWFEEPVSSDDLEGLRMLAARCPAGMDIAAGEYGYEPIYFRRMLEADAVDVIQIDATRCGGVTGFSLAAAAAEVFHRPISAHTAPSLHGHLCCTQPRARNVEYFFDHVRIEGMLMEGALTAVNGLLTPDLSAPGLGLIFKKPDAERYQVYSRHLSAGAI
ncbi:MAG TPA: enolase C-terminal domain-like protein [Bryobacteraceae bacterium]|nr:enolase C-terminal domain-like protein [Bryobacteraceae bacterium]